MKLPASLLVIIFYSTLIPQSSHPFEKFLPDFISKHKEIKHIYLESIENIAEENPDLIYFYLESLNLKFASKDPININKANLLFDNSKKIIESAKYAWIENLIVEIDYQDFPDKIKQEMKYLAKNFYDEDLVSNAGSEKTTNYDKNLADFFVVLYYTKESMDYDPATNYNALRLQIERQEVNNVLRELQNSGDFDDIYNLAKYWQYFYLTNNDAEFISAVGNIVNQYYSISDQPILTLNVGKLTLLSKFNFDTKIETNLQTFSYDYKSEANLLGFSIPIGYKIYLKDYIGIFSFLEFQFNYSWFTINESKTFERKHHINFLAAPEKESVVILENKITLNNKSAFSLKICTPLFYLNKSIYINGGIFTSALLQPYTHEYKYSYQRYIPGFYNPKILEQYEIEKSESAANLSFMAFPSFGIVYNTSWGLNFQADAFLENILISAGYAIF